MLSVDIALPEVEELQRLVEQGLEKGFLTYDEIVAGLEVEAGETLAIGDVEIQAVPAEHDRGRARSARRPIRSATSSRARRSIYFAGDTDLFDGMADLGPVDVALIPIWGWGPGLGGGHLDPERAAEAVARIRPKIAIPIHWGTYFPIHLGLTGRPGFVDLPPVRIRCGAEGARARRRAAGPAVGEGTDV